MSAVCVVVPVYRNGPCLPDLHARLAAALTGSAWTLQLVVDACPADGLAQASALALGRPEVSVTALDRNVGQHRALVAGLVAEPAASAWVVMDGDGQDPPEAVPGLLDLLGRGWSGVFAGRTGGYQGAGRSLTGTAHRALLARLTDLPPDAGAFFAMDPRLRAAVVDAVEHRGAPSVVAAAGRSDLPLTSVPVARDVRTVGTSAWTGRARLRQGLRTCAWAAKDRAGLGRRPPSSQVPSSHGAPADPTLDGTPHHDLRRTP